MNSTQWRHCFLGYISNLTYLEQSTALIGVGANPMSASYRMPTYNVHYLFDPE